MEDILKYELSICMTGIGTKDDGYTSSIKGDGVEQLKEQFQDLVLTCAQTHDTSGVFKVESTITCDGEYFDSDEFIIQISSEFPGEARFVDEHETAHWYYGNKTLAIFHNQYKPVNGYNIQLAKNLKDLDTAIDNGCQLYFIVDESLNDYIKSLIK